MSWALAESSSVAEASVVELSPIAVMTARMLAIEASSDAAIRPTSSLLSMPAEPRRSPSASPASTARTLLQRPDDRAGDDPAEAGASTRTPAAATTSARVMAVLRWPSAVRGGRLGVGGDRVAHRGQLLLEGGEGLGEGG